MSDSSVFQAWNLLHESILMLRLFPVPFVSFYFILWKKLFHDCYCISNAIKVELFRHDYLRSRVYKCLSLSSFSSCDISAILDFDEILVLISWISHLCIFVIKCSNINEGENDSIYKKMCIRYIRWWRVLKALIRLFNRVTDSKSIALCKYLH